LIYKVLSIKSELNPTRIAINPLIGMKRMKILFFSPDFFMIKKLRTSIGNIDSNNDPVIKTMQTS
jgi:hypothetical protein